MNTAGEMFRKKVFGFYGFLAVVNLSGWVWALIAFRDNTLLLGTALISYTFGLRHAVDADHIAAIDNVTRKLMQDGKRPAAVGFFFSLGHSTVVLIASLGVYLAASSLQNQFVALKEIGNLVGTSISAIFLIGIALMNIWILGNVYRTFRRVKNGVRYDNRELDGLLMPGGVMARIFHPLFRSLSSSWQMYPIGFLFGLGFDTATEIAVLGVSAAAATKGLSVSSMMVFPVLFTAGMTFVDTTDGILMVGAYGWAFAKPIRKLYYNMTITFVSVVVALVIGGIEVLRLLRDKLEFRGGIWDLIENLNSGFGALGFFIIAFFILSWGGSVLLYRLKGFDRLE
jgi:high-affinity nickel-transport protein